MSTEITKLPEDPDKAKDTAKVGGLGGKDPEDEAKIKCKKSFKTEGYTAIMGGAGARKPIDFGGHTTGKIYGLPDISAGAILVP